MAGGQHDRSAAEAIRDDRWAKETVQDATVHPATGTCGWSQSVMVCGFQRLVSQREWGADRSLDDNGCAQPVSAALPGGGEDGHGTSAGDL